MPALGEDFFEKDTPAVFRWVWFCGWDVETNCSADNSCKGQVTHPGMGEIFVTCADISSVANCKGNKSKISDFVKDAFKAYGCCVAGAGPGPAPKPETTTNAPTTSHDVTTGPSTTTGPIPEGDRCVGEPFANTCKGRCQAYCNSKYGAVAKNQCWGYEEGHPGSEFILCVCGNKGEKDGPVVLSGCECHREGGCKESTMLLL